MEKQQNNFYLPKCAVISVYLVFFDIYCLSHGRDELTIERFLHQFCYRDQLEPLVNQWLQAWVKNNGFLDELERPLYKVSEIVAHATQYPEHRFNWYQQSALQEGIKCIIVQFTYDKKVVFGISIEEKQADGTDNFLRALAIEATICRVTGAYKSYIAVEYPPAADEEDFDADVVMWRQMRDQLSRDLV